MATKGTLWLWMFPRAASGTRLLLAQITRTLGRSGGGVSYSLRGAGGSPWMQDMSASTTAAAVPVLSRAEAVERLERGAHEKARSEYYAFYSSVLGGVVAGPELMVVPFDDHLVHRGHGVFDTCNIINGKVYALDFHMERFQRSCELAEIPLTAPLSTYKAIIAKTALASGHAEDECFIKFWAGRVCGFDAYLSSRSLSCIPFPRRQTPREVLCLHLWCSFKRLCVITISS